jgi:hypothetical protein
MKKNEYMLVVNTQQTLETLAPRVQDRKKKVENQTVNGSQGQTKLSKIGQYEYI